MVDDPIDGTFKALSVPRYPHSKRKRKSSNLPGVLTLNPQEESWRFIQGSFKHFPFARGLCSNGVLYYEAFLKRDMADRFIMSFHVRTETFSMIQVPLQWKGTSGHLLNYEGRLARLVSTYWDEFIKLWVLDDAERHEWSDISFSLPFPLNDPVSRTVLRVQGMNYAGEFIYVPRDLSGSFHVLYFDPKRNICRRVLYEGITPMDSETNMLFPITSRDPCLYNRDG